MRPEIESGMVREIELAVRVAIVAKTLLEIAPVWGVQRQGARYR